MTIREICEAGPELLALLEIVDAGEEVLFSRDGHPVAKLITVKCDESPRKLGALKGQIWMSDDFDAPI